MGKYSEDGKELLRLVGGRENIAAVSHCITRMRFVLSDPSKADVEAIEAMKVVKGSFTQSGQFQVIIGNAVSDFYNDFVAVAGIEGVSKDAVNEAAKQNQTPLQRAIAALAEIFAPLIPAIITGGLILGFRNCMDSIYLFENGTKTLCDISQFWSGIDSFLWLIGEAIFHMFGTMEDMEELILEGKKRGIGLMLDMVFNHTSTSHSWFQKALSGEKEYQDYYIWEEGTPDKAPTNWESKFGGPAWEYVPSLKKWYLHLFDVTQADLNWKNPKVRQELKNVIRF